MSPLRAVEPEKILKRPRILFYGPPGVGKTTAAIQLPSVYLIDTERGAENDEYVEALRKSGGAYFGVAQGATDLGAIRDELRTLLTEEHEFRTVVIDTITLPYNHELDLEVQRLGSDDYGRHKKGPDRIMREICSLIDRLDMNAVLIAHQKAKWLRSTDARGRDVLAQDGFTFDAYAKLEYIFDLVLRIDRKRNEEPTALVTKTRHKGFGLFEAFEFSYEALAERYGQQLMERWAQPVKLATREQVVKVHTLIRGSEWPERSQNTEHGKIWGWRLALERAGAEDWPDMPQDAIQAFIDYLTDPWAKKKPKKKESK